MANIKSAKKRILVNEKNRQRNVAKRTEVKGMIKKFDSAIASKDVAKAEVLLKECMSVINSAYSYGIFHRNAASRKIASLSKKLDAIKA